MSMESSFVVSGSRKHIKKQPRNRPLPEIFVEREDNNNLRYRSDLRHSTPYYNQQDDKKGVTSVHHDSGFADWSASSSRYEDVSRSSEVDNASFWTTVSSPVLDLKKKFRSRQSFVDEKPKFKFNAENLVKVVMFVVLFSSIMFSVFMGMSLTDNINGKLRAVKFGSEKRLITLKNNSRLLDYDIKDEFGNVLGGKKASIQFAYNMMQKAEGKPTMETGNAEKPAAKREEPKIIEAPAPKVNKVEVESPVRVNREPIKREIQPSSIYELSERIKELTSMLQDDVDDDEDEFVNIEKEIKALRMRKRSLIKKLQKTEKARPLKTRAKQALSKLEYLNPSELPALAGEAATTKPTKKVKPPVSEVKNPLGVPKKLKQSLPKKLSRRKTKKAVELKKIEEDDEEDDIDEDDEGAEDEDYPDDPTFRGKQEM